MQATRRATARGAGDRARVPAATRSCSATCWSTSGCGARALAGRRRRLAGSRASSRASCRSKVASRRPLELAEETRSYILEPPGASGARPGRAPPRPAWWCRCSTTSPAPASRSRACSPTRDEIPYEVVVVDNGSRRADPRVPGGARRPQSARPHVIRNEQQPRLRRRLQPGARAAAGEMLVLLNNDPIVSPGWLSGLAAHLDDPAIGLVGADHQPLRAGARRFPPRTRRTGRCCASPAGAASSGGERRPRHRPSPRCSASRCAARCSKRSAARRALEIGMFEDDYDAAASATPATGSSARTTSSCIASAADSQRAPRPTPSADGELRTDRGRRSTPRARRVDGAGRERRRRGASPASTDTRSGTSRSSTMAATLAAIRPTRKRSRSSSGSASGAPNTCGPGDGALVARAPRGIPAPPRALRAPVRRP